MFCSVFEPFSGKGPLEDISRRQVSPCREPRKKGNPTSATVKRDEGGQDLEKIRQ